MHKVGEYLFIIIVSTISILDEQNKQMFDFTLLDELFKTLNLHSRYDVWNRYVRNLLQKINRDPKSWSTITVERCIFENILVESGSTVHVFLPC